MCTSNELSHVLWLGFTRILEDFTFVTGSQVVSGVLCGRILVCLPTSLAGKGLAASRSLALWNHFFLLLFISPAYHTLSCLNSPLTEVESTRLLFKDICFFLIGFFLSINQRLVIWKVVILEDNSPPASSRYSQLMIVYSSVVFNICGSGPLVFFNPALQRMTELWLHSFL